MGRLLYLHSDLVNFVKIMPINIESLSAIFPKLFWQNCEFQYKKYSKYPG